MLLMKLALLTCAFYMGIVFLIEVASVILACLMGGFGIAGKAWGWGVLCGVIWLISFSLAWRIVDAGMMARFSNLHP